VEPKREVAPDLRLSPLAKCTPRQVMCGNGGKMSLPSAGRCPGHAGRALGECSAVGPLNAVERSTACAERRGQTCSLSLGFALPRLWSCRAQCLKRRQWKGGQNTWTPSSSRPTHGKRLKL